MSVGRTRNEKIAVATAAAAAVWTVGAAMFYQSGAINTSGVLPTVGCLIALWGGVRSDTRLMWFGTGVILLSTVLLVFSVGLPVAPAALALTLGSLILGRSPDLASR